MQIVHPATIYDFFLCDLQHFSNFQSNIQNEFFKNNNIAKCEGYVAIYFDVFEQKQNFISNLNMRRVVFSRKQNTR